MLKYGEALPLSGLGEATVTTCGQARMFLENGELFEDEPRNPVTPVSAEGAAVEGLQIESTNPHLPQNRNLEETMRRSPADDPILLFPEKLSGLSQRLW